MMAKATGGEITEATRVKLSLPLPVWASLAACILATGAYLANLQYQQSDLFRAVKQIADSDERQDQRIGYQEAVMIQKGLMLPGDPRP
jgi:hypothetical protein